MIYDIPEHTLESMLDDEVLKVDNVCRKCNNKNMIKERNE